MAKTTTFHITYYDYDKSVYIQFLTCNFSCLGCIRRGYLWDHHYGNEGSLLGKSRVELLEVEKLGEILKIVERELGLQRAVLGGGEPTADPLLQSYRNTEWHELRDCSFDQWLPAGQSSELYT
jgi:organic radical activating enzyme